MAASACVPQVAAGKALGSASVGFRAAKQTRSVVGMLKAGSLLRPSHATFSSPTSFLGEQMHNPAPFTRARRSRGGALTSSCQVASTAVSTEEYAKQLQGAKGAIEDLIRSKNCNPIVVRLAWHDSGTYDKSFEWPQSGGATGSIRFKPEIDHNANAGLNNAILLFEDIKKQYPAVSYADLYQLASATAIELAGGPVIDMRYGRVDANSPEECAVDGRLPAADPPTPADHLRTVFYRMGLNDQDIVALSGAHTLGRARPDRSGFGKEETKYTKDGPGNPGGQSWTVEWLKFDNSYFKDVKAKADADLLVLPTDAALFEDESFKKYAEKYAADQSAFFSDYAVSHKKLSELGSRFSPPEGVKLPAPTAFKAADYSSNDYSDYMKKKMRDEYLGLGGSPDQPLQGNPFLVIIAIVAVLAILSKLTGAI